MSRAMRDDLSEKERTEIALKIYDHLQGLSVMDAASILGDVKDVLLKAYTPVPDATDEFKVRIRRHFASYLDR